MRIAFVGKGGSGKTTLSALLSRHLARSGAPVLAVDGDINQHLAEALGHDGSGTWDAPPWARTWPTSRTSCAVPIRASPPARR